MLNLDATGYRRYLKKIKTRFSYIRDPYSFRLSREISFYFIPPPQGVASGAWKSDNKRSAPVGHGMPVGVSSVCNVNRFLFYELFFCKKKRNTPCTLYNMIMLNKTKRISTFSNA